MIGTMTIPSLPPSFDRVRILSRVLSYFFLVNFWVTAVWLTTAVAMPVWPQAARFTMDDSLVSALGIGRLHFEPLLAFGTADENASILS